MAKSDQKAEYSKPATQVYLENLYEMEDAEQPGEARSFQVEGNDTSAYVGTDVIYRNYSEETHKPFAADEGAEQEAEKRNAAASALPDEDLAVKAREEEEKAASKQSKDDDEESSSSVPSVPKGTSPATGSQKTTAK